MSEQRGVRQHNTVQKSPVEEKRVRRRLLGYDVRHRSDPARRGLGQRQETIHQGDGDLRDQRLGEVEADHDSEERDGHCRIAHASRAP